MLYQKSIQEENIRIILAIVKRIESLLSEEEDISVLTRSVKVFFDMYLSLEKYNGSPKNTLSDINSDIDEKRKLLFEKITRIQESYAQADNRANEQ